MEALEALLNFLSQAAGWLVLLAVNLALLIYVLSAIYAQCLKDAAEQNGEWQTGPRDFGDWPTPPESFDTPTPGPGIFSQTLSASWVTFGLAAVILGGEALFVLHLKGWI